VHGFYKCDGIFQILPPDEAAPKPPIAIAHHPLIIEYCFIRLKLDFFPGQKAVTFKNPYLSG
jgi:hypothetical protein